MVDVDLAENWSRILLDLLDLLKVLSLDSLQAISEESEAACVLQMGWSGVCCSTEQQFDEVWPC